MATVLEECNTEENNSVVLFFCAKMSATDIHK
jgi:hypothetical protein